MLVDSVARVEVGPVTTDVVVTAAATEIKPAASKAPAENRILFLDRSTSAAEGD